MSGLNYEVKPKIVKVPLAAAIDGKIYRSFLYKRYNSSGFTIYFRIGTLMVFSKIVEVIIL